MKRFILILALVIFACLALIELRSCRTKAQLGRRESQGLLVSKGSRGYPVREAAAAGSWAWQLPGPKNRL